MRLLISWSKWWVVARGVFGPLLLCLAAVALLFAAGQLPVVPMQGQLGPDFWPRVVLIGLMGACVVKALEAIRGRGVTADEADETDETALPSFSLPKLTGSVALILSYAAVTPLLGFPLATLLFFLTFTRLAGMRRPSHLLLISGLGTVMLLYLFVKIVYLPLPKGVGLMEDFTIFLYRLLGIF